MGARIEFGEVCELGRAAIATLADGPRTQRALVQTFGAPVRAALVKGRAAGQCYAEGPGRVESWFSTAWWLTKWNALVWRKVQDVARQANAQGKHAPPEDLYGEAALIVYKHVRSFRPKLVANPKGEMVPVQFVTYATRRLANNLWRAVSDWNTDLSVPVGTRAEMAIAGTLPKRAAEPTRADEPAVLDRLADGDAAEPDVKVPDDFWKLATTGMSERDAALFVARTRDLRTLEAIAAEFGVTRQRVQQIVDRQLKTLKHSAALWGWQ